MERVERFAFHWRGVVLVLLVMFCLLVDVADVEWDTLVLPLGSAFFGLGAALRLWAQIHLDNRLNSGRAFATSGPSAKVRNPKHIGSIALFTGLAIFAEAVYIAPLVVLVAFGLYSLSVRHEERLSRRRYGPSYERYLAEVPRWIPSFSSSRQTGISNSNLKLSLRAERLVWLALLPFILLEIFYT